MSKLPALEPSPNAVDFIDDAAIEEMLARARGADAAWVRDIIAKALSKQPLAPAETAVLLACEDPALHEEMFAAARRLKETVYGNRIVLFAPLYIGNRCVNDCAYCGFRASNREAIRRELEQDDIRKQVAALERMGHKRLILVFGEHPDYDAQFIADCVRTVYEAGDIRRVNINAPPLDVEGYRIVKQAKIGTYQIFQETYHHETYARVHDPRTRKGHYLWRLDGLSRAFEAGIDDLGIGALFGLYDWKFEVMGLVTHAQYLMQRHGVGPHTISFPRLRPALGVNFGSRWLVSDADFLRLVAILRLSVPYTGLICTAREPAHIRDTILGFGVSQIDAGTNIDLGGYAESGDAQVVEQRRTHLERAQFELGDLRSLDEVVGKLVDSGYIPSFCTACYRVGRTGEVFMEYAIPGFIQKLCTPNALTTFQEYLCDHASPEVRAKGEAMIAAELEKIGDEKVRRMVEERLRLIREQGKRDLYV
ncbi:MAG: [FeFe] hydrogenase H-cluster radical SAM maturase HydG [Planctomycetota bacterium]|nr:[FeFe] hydrogenase H-cluster radical SAM maturase HydG [Planctomycetota bacterium]MCX8040784.1 [FeFe] hydrogenase H-cluster radical SAM maturase HydG [Planctomycetota bacterium]MDW8372026.1 [FeFe] hydrogenase H-cluster radical SAM maturase HydG [Planctomycetota bacterium]